MRVTLPHEHSRAEIRRRLHKHNDKIAGFFPPGLADVKTGWPEEDRMEMHVTVMGRTFTGEVQVNESDVVIAIELPLMFSVMRAPLEASVRKEAARLLK